MSAATIFALGSMLRDQMTHGMMETEQFFAAKLQMPNGGTKGDCVLPGQRPWRRPYLAHRYIGEQRNMSPKILKLRRWRGRSLLAVALWRSRWLMLRLPAQDMIVGSVGYQGVDMIDVKPPLAY